ncbi:hypothetical protein BAZMOX_249438_0 [methanotrophic endosymbiont of Bathymodiolus azoricus (Menez Gwen)]|nr:hypothetical protein BAZMOX_249438_0 [methanotrophic endosymbiont of Bathymodiolus azoricus (Menez Gwen)]
MIARLSGISNSVPFEAAVDSLAIAENNSSVNNSVFICKVPAQGLLKVKSYWPLGRTILLNT